MLLEDVDNNNALHRANSIFETFLNTDARSELKQEQMKNRVKE